MEFSTRSSLRYLVAVLSPLALAIAGCSSDDGGPVATPGNTTNVARAQVTLENPTPPPLPIYDLWAVGPAAVAACGDAGFAAIFEGAGWRMLNTGVAARLTAVWGTAPEDVYFAGDSGCLLHWNGTTLTTLDAGDDYWSDMWGDAATGDVWLASNTGVTRLSGVGTRRFTSPEIPSGSKHGIAGSATDDVYAVDSFGLVVHWNGTAWTTITTGLGTTRLNKVEVVGDEIFVAGDDGELWHFDGTMWSSFDSPAATFDDFIAISGIDSNRVFAFRQDRSIYRWSGSAWFANANAYFPTSYVFNAGCVTPTGDLVVGGNGYSGVVSNISWRSNGTWSSLSESAIATQDLTDVWVFDADDAIAVGEGGTIVQRDASGWTDVVHGLTTEKLWGVWASGPNNVYAVGDGGVVLHRDATTWTTLDPGADDSDLYGVWGSSPSNVWAVGNEVLWHWNGSTWTQRWSELPDTLASYSEIYVAPGGDVFLAASDLAHYDGSQWEASPIKSQYGVSVYDIWGSSASDVWMTGYPGVFHYDGTEVRLRWFTDDTDPTAITGLGPDNVLAAGARGLVQFADGIPSLLPIPARDILGGGTGTDGTSYFVGNTGLIVRVD